MNRSESKYFNTAHLMDEALIALLEIKDFEYITVKEICERAGVNRSTFYLHYETIQDLLAETMEHIMQQFLEAFPVTPERFIAGILSAPLDELILINSSYLRPYLTFIQSHKSVYAAAYKNPACLQVVNKLEGMTKYVLQPIMHRFQIPEDEQPYRVQFYIHGCTAIIQTWLKGNCEDSIEKIERILTDCILPREEGTDGHA